MWFELRLNSAADTYTIPPTSSILNVFKLSAKAFASDGNMT